MTFAGSLNKPFFVSLLLIPLLQCSGLEEFSTKTHFYGLIWLFDYLFSLYLFLKNKKFIDKNVWLILLMYFIICISTLLYTNFGGIISKTIDCVSFFIIVDYYLRNEPVTFLKGFINLSLVIMIFQLFSLLIYFQGFNRDETLDINENERVFFCSKNFAAYFYMAMICTVFYFKRLSHAYNKRCILLTVLCAICAVLQWSGTGVTGITVYLIILLGTKLNIIKKCTKFLTNHLIVFALTITTVFLLLISRNISFLTYFVEDVLHKDMTFTGRTDLWDLSLLKIIQSPLLGSGSCTEGRVTLIERYGMELSSHNMFLEIAVQGGISALVVFIMWYFGCLKATKYSDNKSRIIICGAIFLQFVMYMFEGIPYTIFPLIVFSMGYYCKYHTHLIKCKRPKLTSCQKSLKCRPLRHQTYNRKVYGKRQGQII